jgi:site-specific DNA-methyltransferase (adenine-specific)
MSNATLPVDQIIEGDCLRVLPTLPDESVDLVFADPPYNLQLRQELYRPNMTLVDAVNDQWDKFSSFQEYDDFTRAWLTACRRVLKKTGTIWVIGSYHNIFRVGAIMQDIGYWILNDVVWVKTNPMPNFRGVRFTNAHETLIWASKAQGSKYTFNHHAVKAYNNGKQMRSDWLLPICSGAERIRDNGQKAHSTQKPEALLERVIAAASKPGDLVLDPFVGSGTTAAVAKRLHRHWIGIEKEPEYVTIAMRRLSEVTPAMFPDIVSDPRDEARSRKRIPFKDLVTRGLLKPGQSLFFRRDLSRKATVTERGTLALNGFEGSIHKAGARLMNGSPCNGWEHWYFTAPDGQMRPIDDLRKRVDQ